MKSVVAVAGLAAVVAAAPAVVPKVDVAGALHKRALTGALPDQPPLPNPTLMTRPADPDILNFALTLEHLEATF